MLRIMVSTRSLLITGLIKGCLDLYICMKQRHSICFTVEKQSEYERESLQRQEEYNSEEHCYALTNCFVVSHTLKNMSVGYTVHKR